MGKSSKFSLDISAGGYIVCALLLLLIPVKWLLAVVFAAFFHELCHWTAIRLCGRQVTKISIRDSGVVMEAPDLSPWQELVCALAGPAGSFLLLIPIRRFTLLSLCALVQGMFNLLPVFPLDGGRVLRSAFMLLSGNGAQLFYKVQKGILVILFTAGIVLSIRFHFLAEMAIITILLLIRLRCGILG